MRAGKESLAFLLSIGFHVGLALVVAAVMVRPALLSGGIQVYLGGGSSVGGTGGTGHLPASAPAGKHSAKTSPSGTPAVSKRAHHETAAQRVEPHHHRTSKQNVHRLERIPKTAAVPVHPHKESRRRVVSAKETERAARNKSRTVRPKPVQPALARPAPHPSAGSPAAQAASGSGHLAAGKGTGTGHGAGAGSGLGKGEGHAPNLRAYYGAVLARIQAAKHYPWVARRRRMQGVTRIFFRLSRAGKLLWARIARSSGFTILDKAAVAAVRNAAPYPGFPGTKAEMPASMAVNVYFVLK